MIRNKKIKVFGILLFMFVLCITVTSINAASLSISASATSVTVGSSATVYVTGNDLIGRVNISSSNSNVASVSTGSLWVEGSTSFKVTAKTVGSATITISPVSVANGKGEDVSVSSRTVTIYVKAPYVDTRSKNNNLASLSIEGYNLEFNKDNTSYSLDVGYDVEKLNIDTTLEDSKASVKIEGNENLAPGENIIKIIVTAENTVQKVYEIKVNKAKNPNDVNAFLKTLTISNATMKNQFEKEKYEYLCEDITADVKNLDISYETEVEGAKVEVLGNEELSIGVNHITVKVTSKDESEKKEYNILVYKSEKIAALTQVENKTTKEKIVSWVRENKITVLCLVVILILIIVVVLLIIKNRKNHSNDSNLYEESEVRRHRRNALREENESNYEALEKEQNVAEEYDNVLAEHENAEETFEKLSSIENSTEDEKSEFDIDKKIKELNELDDINEIEEGIQDIKEDLDNDEKNDIE